MLSPGIPFVFSSSDHRHLNNFSFSWLLFQYVIEIWYYHKYWCAFHALHWAYRPRANTMLKIWDWERFQFSIDYEHKQAKEKHAHSLCASIESWWAYCYVWQHKTLLERKLPDALKLAIAKQIENNLFSKVTALHLCCIHWGHGEKELIKYLCLPAQLVQNPTRSDSYRRTVEQWHANSMTGLISQWNARHGRDSHNVLCRGVQFR